MLWECVSLLDDETAAAVEALGGLAAIAISHPHYYSSMVEWAHRFECPVLLHRDDAEWIMRPDRRDRALGGRDARARRADADAARRALRAAAPCCTGPTAPAARRAAVGRHRAGDPRPRHVGVHVLLPEPDPAAARPTVERMAAALEPYAVRDDPGRLVGRRCRRDGKAVVRRSARALRPRASRASCPEGQVRLCRTPSAGTGRTMQVWVRSRARWPGAADRLAGPRRAAASRQPGRARPRLARDRRARLRAPTRAAARATRTAPGSRARARAASLSARGGDVVRVLLLARRAARHAAPPCWPGRSWPRRPATRWSARVVLALAVALGAAPGARAAGRRAALPWIGRGLAARARRRRGRPRRRRARRRRGRGRAGSAASAAAAPRSAAPGAPSRAASCPGRRARARCAPRRSPASCWPSSCPPRAAAVLLVMLAQSGGRLLPLAPASVAASVGDARRRLRARHRRRRCRPAPSPRSWSG